MKSAFSKKGSINYDNYEIKIIILHVFRQVREDIKNRNNMIREEAIEWIKNSDDPVLTIYLKFIDYDLEDVYKWIGLKKDIKY